MGAAILEAIRAGAAYLKEDGIWVALGVFLLVLLAAFRKKSDEATIKSLPQDQQRKIQQRQDSYQSTGTAIGCLGAVIITLWMVYEILFG